MEVTLCIALNLRVEARWAPVLREEWDRDDLAETIDLKAAAAHSADDGGVVDHIHVDTCLHAAQVQISVGCCTEWITDDQEANFHCLGLLDHLSAATLDEISISNGDFLPKELRKALVRDHQDRRVHLEVDFVA